MGSTELAANLFRATQTEEKLRREDINTKVQANNIHFEVGAKVRQTIKELGGTMPKKYYYCPLNFLGRYKFRAATSHEVSALFVTFAFANKLR